MRDGHVVVTGGAGFIGSNLADRLARAGREVVVVDSFARDGVELNARWLEGRHARRVRVVRGDVRDVAAWRSALDGAAAVFHLAAQVAVTTSVIEPLEDFEVNARGTLNLLEELRGLALPPALVYTSTNKVFGALDDVPLRRAATRYVPQDPGLGARGIGASRPLDFHSPYGCSKGCADQYVIDYARTYGLPAVVFRMSCIYGPRQLGTEDQGWVAHFLRRALEDLPVTIYGDGLQVRDLLFVDDLVEALVAAAEGAPRIAGRAFNIGGGPPNTISLVELVERIEDLAGRRPRLEFADWRPGDQRWYVSDTSAFTSATGWTPRTGVGDGLAALHAWINELHDARRTAS